MTNRTQSGVGLRGLVATVAGWVRAEDLEPGMAVIGYIGGGMRGSVYLQHVELVEVPRRHMTTVQCHGLEDFDCTLNVRLASFGHGGLAHSDFVSVFTVHPGYRVVSLNQDGHKIDRATVKNVTNAEWMDFDPTGTVEVVSLKFAVPFQYFYNRVLIQEP